jgi:hypothetical protein
MIDQDGYTPRLLSVDTVGGGSFQPSETKVEDNVVQMDYRKSSNNGVQYWTDYSMTETHPSSYLTLPYSESCVDGTFDYYHQGKEAFRQQWHGFESMEDKLRKMIEESDSAQGFTLVCDMDDGFAGLTAATIRHIEEEYKKHVFVVGISPPSATEKGEAGKELLKLSRMNQMLLFGAVLETTFIPIYTRSEPFHPLEKADFSQLFHQSAYISTSIESITTGLRLRERITLNSLCSRRIMGLGMQLGYQGDIMSSTLPGTIRVYLAN